MNFKSISFYLSLFCFPITISAFINILYSSYFDYFLSIESYFLTLIFSTALGAGFYFFGKKSDKKIVSRIGLEAEAIPIDKDFNFFDYIKDQDHKSLSCVFIDEVQFLSKEQIQQLGRIADEINLPVMCYGIRTDFQGKLFDGSSELLAIADNLIELKTICSECDKKATMVVRLDSNGKVLLEGEKVLVGGNDIYKTVCRKHFRDLTKLI